MYSGYGCLSSYSVYDLPYENCLGCNAFNDLSNDDSSSYTLPTGIVILIVILVIFAVCCSLFGVLFGCGVLSAAAVTGICCCYSRRKAPDYRTGADSSTAVNTTPLPHAGLPSGTAYEPPPPAYSYVTAVPLTNVPSQMYSGAAPVQSQAVGAPPSYDLETISVFIPQGAYPGATLQANNSKGQPVQFTVPQNVVPGQVIQVQVKSNIS